MKRHYQKLTLGVFTLAVVGFAVYSLKAGPAAGDPQPTFQDYSFPQFSPVRISRSVENDFLVTDSYTGQLLLFGPKGRVIRAIALQGEPLAVAIDRTDRIFVGNATLGTVDIYTRRGLYRGTLGAPVSKPSDIALAEEERLLFVTDSSEHVVKVFDLDSGAFRYQFGSQGSGAGQFNYPTGIAYDPTTHTVVVGDFLNRRLQVFAVSGFWLRTIQKTDQPTLVRPQGLGVDEAGNIYVAEAFWAKVYVFDSAGNFLRTWGEYGSGNGQLRTPLDVAVRPDGAVLVTDYANGRVAVFSEQGGGSQP